MSRNSYSAGISEPYAEALMSLAQAHDLVDRFGEDTKFLLSVLQDSQELQQFLGSPIVEAEAKKQVVRRVVGDQIHPYTLNFLMLLVERRRILFLTGICQHYQATLRKLNRTVLAEVISTVELTEAQQQTVIARVQQMSGAEQVELQRRIDPELIGGVLIKVGSQVLDASIRGQLRRITYSLMNSAG